MMPYLRWHLILLALAVVLLIIAMHHKQPVEGKPASVRHTPILRSRGVPGVTGSLPHWQALFQCESSNNPRAISPGGRYRGLAQFDRQTWASVGGHGDPADASRAEQTLRAQMLYVRRGRQPWPRCGRRL